MQDIFEGQHASVNISICDERDAGTFAIYASIADRGQFGGKIPWAYIAGCEDLLKQFTNNEDKKRERRLAWSRVFIIYNGVSMGWVTYNAIDNAFTVQIPKERISRMQLAVEVVQDTQENISMIRVVQ